MICIQSAYVPKTRKTDNSNQWSGYLSSKLKELRGYDKHKNTTNPAKV
jgi:hypothetical protein